MNNQWQQFLQGCGAQIVDGTVTGFEQSANGDDLMVDLSHLGIIHIGGEEAASFLQSMLTNDIKQVDATHSQLSALLSPKGRMLALFRLMSDGSAGFLMLPPRTMTEMLLKRLRMFVLRAKVTLEERSDTLVRIGVSGAGAERALAELMGPLPDDADHVAEKDALHAVRLSGPAPRFLLVGETDTMIPAWEWLQKRGVSPSGPDSWELGEIAAGVPAVYPDSSEAFVPQMANLQKINGVSFTKGCYPGQEVVARSQYLGKLKRRMYRARID